MFRLKPDKDIRTEKGSADGVPLLILRPKEQKEPGPAVLWIHGGGYILGMKEMVHISRAVDLVKRFGALVISPGYRMALSAPYPAAIEDCYKALLYLKEHAAGLSARDDQIMVGGESAGGGLTAALCMMARDRGEVKIAFQMPLYPMLDDRDTPSSRDNHGRVWNTRRNHIGWNLYLRGTDREDLSPYASLAHQTDYSGLPPAYTFVGKGEPFYCETLEYVRLLKEAGVPAKADVYDTDMHAFDMLVPEREISQKAAARFREEFAWAVEHYFAPQS